ncbi:MAG: S8 family serine peptidase [Bacteroidota bacterium]
MNPDKSSCLTWHIYLLGLIILTLPQLAMGQQVNPVQEYSISELQQLYDQGRAVSSKIIVQFESRFADEVANELRRKRKSSGETVQLGIPQVDQLNQEYKVKSMTRAFTPAGKFEAMHRAYGLHRWYILEVEAGQEAAALSDFNYLGDVSYAQPNMKMQRSEKDENFIPAANYSPNDPKYGEQWHYHNTGQVDGKEDADIDLPEALDTEGGRQEVIVSIVDSGIDTDHPDLKNMLWVNTAEQNGTPGVDDDNNGFVDDIHGWNHANSNNNVDDDASDNGHGTHVAGTVGAQNNNSTGVVGIAGGNGTDSGVRLMANRVFGKFGAQADNFGDALVYAADNGAVISQNSWGYGSRLSSLFYMEKQAIDYFNERAGLDNTDADDDGTPDQDTQIGPMNGGLVVFAAGNDNADSKDGKHWYPAYYDTTMAVAASTNRDERAEYSNYGTWIDITAPGGQIENFSVTNGPRGILSTIPPSSNSSNAYYGWYQGTSMACPHVSGVAALVVSKLGKFSDQSSQNLTNGELRSILEGSADYIYDENPYQLYELGKGRLNAAKAVQGRNTTAPAALSDLTASAVKSDALELQWTAPGADDQTGRAYNYDMRISTSSISNSNFDTAEQIDTPMPDSAGNVEKLEIKNLDYNTTYHVALVAYDGYGNQSTLVTKQFTTAPAPTVSVSDTDVEAYVSSGSTKTQTVTITNNGSSGSVLEYGFKGYSDPNQLKSGEANDGSGYKYVDDSESDGPTYNWKDISQIGTRVTTSYTQSLPEVTLPFDFPFYGEIMQSVKISGGGALTFSNQDLAAAWYGESPIPSSGSSMAFDHFIAPLQGVVNDNNSLKVNVFHHYDPESGNFIVQWDQVPIRSHMTKDGVDDSTSTFQAILNPRGGIKFQYKNLGYDTSVSSDGLVGIENKDGTKGIEIANGGTYIKEQMAIRITTPDDWLRIEPSNGEIASGQSKTVTFTFDGNTPLFTGQYRKVVTLVTNDGQGQNKEIDMLSTMNLQSTSSADPQISFSENKLTAEAAQGENGSWELTIINNGSSSLDWSGSTQDAWLTLGTSSGSVAANSTQKIAVFYDASGLSAQKHTGALTFSSNDPSNSTTSVDVELTVSSQSVAASELLTVSDGVNSQTLSFGLSDNATDGFDANLDKEAPPEAPEGSFKAFWVANQLNLLEDYRATTEGEVLWQLIVAPEQGQSQISLNWNLSDQSTNYHLLDDTTNPTLQVDMQSVNQKSISMSQKDTLWIARNYSGSSGGGQTVTVSVDYRKGWNMVALPVKMGGSQSVSNLYSTLSSPAAYHYTGSYQSTSNMQFQDGYWVKLSSASSESFQGQKVDSTTIEMDKGWNLVGGLSDTLKDLSTIVDTGNVLVKGALYGFDGSYQPATQIEPGKSYFVQTSAAASIVLDLNPQQTTNQQPLISEGNLLDGFDAITVSSAQTSQTLYANSALPSDWSRDNFALPPKPKGATLDTRMKDDYRLTTGNSFEFFIEANQFPVDVSLENGTESTATYQIEAYKDGSVAKTWTLNADQNISIDQQYDSYKVEKTQTTAIRLPGEQPETLALDQNYPNPFNPSTTINYQVPEATEVRLQVFNMLGRKVADLVNKQQAPGTYQVSFDASNLSSGVYIYRLHTGAKVITKKMILMK